MENFFPTMQFFMVFDSKIILKKFFVIFFEQNEFFKCLEKLDKERKNVFADLISLKKLFFEPFYVLFVIILFYSEILEKIF